MPMPLDAALIAALITVPFILFLAVLAWGEYRTRHR
jgi:hypothetical protein